MDWHDMRNYYRGKTPEGHESFHVPLQTDEDGMIGRECPDEDCEPRYFKIAPREKPETSTKRNVSRGFGHGWQKFSVVR